MSTSYPSLGKYQILEEIGRGGMGAVYKGYDPFLDRTVAIKLLAPHLVWEKNFVERFSREARTAARLQHPNIISIYDVGQDGTNYYFVMAYLTGQSLKQRIAQKGRLAPAEALPILKQLAAALDYAHREGLIHRDVKPANVMFNQHGQPILTDFGIVKAAQEAKLTTTGATIGTPQYMSPEQAQGKSIDTRTDQYALGIIVFQMLTGRVPFDADTVTAILHMQVYDPPPSICALCPELPPAIEAVMQRVLAKSPDGRYISCTEFVRALEQALAQSARAQPAARQARQPGPSPAMAPASKRLPGWTWILGAAAVLMCLVGVGVLALGPRLFATPPTSTPTSTVANKPTLVPTDTPIPTRTPVPLSASAISPGNIAQVTQLKVWDKQYGAQIVWSPDGASLAIATSKVSFYDTKTFTLTRTFETGGSVQAVAFSPDGSLLATASSDVVKLWDVASGSEQHALAKSQGTKSVAFSPDGKMLATGTGIDVKLWDVASGNELHALAGNTDAVNTVVFAPDGQTLAVGSTAVVLWNVASGVPLRTIAPNSIQVTGIAFSPDGKLLAVALLDKTIKLWDAANGSELRALTGHTNTVQSVAFSPDGQLLASGAWDHQMKLWDATDGKELRSLTDHTSLVRSVAFSPDGSLLASASDDGTVRVWGVR